MYLARRKGLGSDQVRSIAMSPSRRAGARLTCSVSPGRPRSSFGGELWATRGAVAMLSFLPSVTTRRCSSIVSVWICRVSSVFVFRSSSETGASERWISWPGSVEHLAPRGDPALDRLGR